MIFFAMYFIDMKALQSASKCIQKTLAASQRVLTKKEIKNQTRTPHMIDS
eukprot:m.167364 g.167364  ORF g.167364 m.167364 type:complete len:50 (-) comp15304_c2_seq4:3612-3761(-)